MENNKSEIFVEKSEKKSKKILIFIISLILFIFIVVGVLFLYFNSSNLNFEILMGNSSSKNPAIYNGEKELTRKEMQNMIVSTALSYFYNNNYSDYEQKKMDKAESFNFRTFNQSPEMINRANQYYTDCSSFGASVYIHTFGYDFSEYYKLSNLVIFYNSNNLYSYNNINNYINAYKYFGKGPNTAFYAKIGAEKKEETNSIVAYNYVVTGDEDENTKNIIKQEIIDTLELGDLIIYRRVKADGSKTGHTIVYIGNEFNLSGGYIHSVGDDYNFSTLSYGIDNYSVTYSNLSVFKKNIFNEDTSRKGSSFTVLRPINKFCVQDKCKISTCKGVDCGTGYLNNNAQARIDLKNIKVEQYAEIIKENLNYNDDLTSSTGTSTLSKSLSKYNSVNMGDNITYNVYLLNRSKMSYCTSASYDNKENCKNSYQNMIITNKLPDNTKFISCTENCKYDAKTNIVTWENVSLGFDSDYEKTYSYKVQVTEEKDILNEGIKIKTQNGNILQFSSIETKVNPTINGLDVNLLKLKVDKFKTLVEAGKIIYNNNSTEYTSKLDDISKINVSENGFIQMIYYDMLGLDLGDLNADNIKEGIFNSSSDGYYTKKLDDKINILTKETHKKINMMLVDGMYGGRLLKGNENKDRAQYLRAADLEIGDIIVYLEGESEKNISTYMFYGLEDNDVNKPVFVKFLSGGENGRIVFYDNNNQEKKGSSLFKEIYSKNLFVVLRPSKLGTTIEYEFNGGVGGTNSYIAYDKYKNLITPTRNNYKFSCWATDKKLNNCINNDETLISNKSHKLYAKWESVNPVVINKYSYDNNKKIIDNIDINTTDDMFKKNIILDDGYSITVDYKVINGVNLLFTGGKTKIYNNNNLMIEYSNIIRGDVNGDGKINYLDYVSVYNHIQKTKKPQSTKKELINEYLISADISRDDKVNYLDYVKIYNLINQLKGGNN